MAQDVPVNTFSNQQVGLRKPSRAFPVQVKLKPSTVFAEGQVIGMLTASPDTYGIYASGNADGTQNAELILARACQTDAAGRITYIDPADLSQTGISGNQWGGADQSTGQAYAHGDVMAALLVGLDANAITVMKGRLIKNGTIFSF